MEPVVLCVLIKNKLDMKHSPTIRGMGEGGEGQSMPNIESA